MPDTGIAPQDPPRMAELLDVAARLFDEKGYRATSLNDLGEALGMNKASLYYYVRSKEELLSRVIYRASQRLRDLADAIIGDAGNPRDALRRLVETHCHTLLDHPHEFGTVIYQRRHIDADTLPQIAGRERAYFEAVRGLILRGIRTGAFRRMDDGIAAQLTLDAINGVLRWYRADGRKSRDAAIAEIVRFVEAALTARPAEKP